VAKETFRTIEGPTYGTVYRGVAYVVAGDQDRDHGHDDHGNGNGNGHDDDYGNGHGNGW